MSDSNGTVQSIDSSGFDDAITKFGNAINIYREARERIFNSTEALLSTWTGVGKNEFQKQYDLLKTKLTDEEENLNTVKEDLEECRQSYEDWDTEIASQLIAKESK